MVLGADKEKPLIANIVAGRVTRRASVGRRNLILTEPNRVVPMEKGGNDRTMLKAQKESKWAQPS